MREPVHPNVVPVIAPITFTRAHPMTDDGEPNNKTLRMLVEGWGKKGVNVIRLEQIQKAQPQTLALACPYCMVMFDDAVKNTGVDETLARKDVAEILLQSLARETGG